MRGPGQLDLQQLPGIVVPDVLRKGAVDHIMPRPFGAALHDEMVFATIGHRDRHDLAVLRVEGDGLFEQERVPQAGRDRVARHLGQLAVGFDRELVIGPGRRNPVHRAVVVGHRVQCHQFAAGPTLSLGLVEAIDRDKSDLDLDMGHHLHGRFRPVAAQLDRVAADLLAITHDCKPHRLGKRFRLCGAAADRKNHRQDQQSRFQKVLPHHHPPRMSHPIRGMGQFQVRFRLLKACRLFSRSKRGRRFPLVTLRREKSGTE